MPTVRDLIARYASPHVLSVVRREAEHPEAVLNCQVEWNPRLRTTAGRVIGLFMELNPKLKLEGDEAVRDTFLHELAHLLTMDEPGHGPQWRRAMRCLGQAPRRCHNYSAMQRRELKPVAQCARCGFIVRRRRALPRTKRWQHSDCGGELLHLDSKDVTFSTNRSTH